MFATQARYKREAFRGSEFAPRILADNDLRVVMKASAPYLSLHDYELRLWFPNGVGPSCAEFAVSALRGPAGALLWSSP